MSAFGNGEDARPIPSPSGRSSGGWFPSFLPGGQYLLEFVPTTSQPENSGVWIVSLETGARSKLVDSQSNAIYAPPGYLLFWREGALWAQPFDVTTRSVRGSPQQVEKAIGLNPVTNQALFSVSDSARWRSLEAPSGSLRGWTIVMATASAVPEPEGLSIPSPYHPMLRASSTASPTLAPRRSISGSQVRR